MPGSAGTATVWRWALKPVCVWLLWQKARGGKRLCRDRCVLGCVASPLHAGAGGCCPLPTDGTGFGMARRFEKGPMHCAMPPQGIPMTLCALAYQERMRTPEGSQGEARMISTGRSTPTMWLFNFVPGAVKLTSTSPMASDCPRLCP